MTLIILFLSITLVIVVDGFVLTTNSSLNGVVFTIIEVSIIVLGDKGWAIIYKE